MGRKRGGNCHTTPLWRKAMDQVGNMRRQADNRGMARSGKDNSKPRKPVERSQRLAMELRENLRRRKAQERGRATSEAAKAPIKASPHQNDEVP